MGIENKLNHDFTREFVGEILIEKIHLHRANLNEAIILNERLSNDFDEGYKKIIVDLSECSYIDSSIVGALVVLLKKLKTKGGKLKVVTSTSDSFQLLTSIGLDNTLDLNSSLDKAISGFGN